MSSDTSSRKRKSTDELAQEEAREAPAAAAAQSKRRGHPEMDMDPQKRPRYEDRLPTLSEFKQHIYDVQLIQLREDMAERMRRIRDMRDECCEEIMDGLGPDIYFPSVVQAFYEEMLALDYKVKWDKKTGTMTFDFFHLWA